MLCDCLGVHIWLSAVGLKLKGGAEIKQVLSDLSSPGSLGPIANCLAP